MPAKPDGDPPRTVSSVPEDDIEPAEGRRGGGHRREEQGRIDSGRRRRRFDRSKRVSGEFHGGAGSRSGGRKLARPLPDGGSTARIEHGHRGRRNDRRRNRGCPGPAGAAADARQHVVEEMAEGAEVVERDTRIGREPVTLPDLAEQLCLADAVDAQIPLEIGIEFDDLLRIPRLLDDKIDKEALQLAPDRRRRRGSNRRNGRNRRGGEVPRRRSGVARSRR